MSKPTLRTVPKWITDSVLPVAKRDCTLPIFVTFNGVGNRITSVPVGSCSCIVLN